MGWIISLSVPQATARLCQAQAAAVVDQCNGQCTVDGHGGVHGFFEIGAHGVFRSTGKLGGWAQNVQLAHLLHQDEPEGFRRTVGQLKKASRYGAVLKHSTQGDFFQQRVG